MTTLKGSAIGLAVLFLTGFGTIAVDSQAASDVKQANCSNTVRSTYLPGRGGSTPNIRSGAGRSADQGRARRRRRRHSGSAGWAHSRCRLNGAAGRTGSEQEAGRVREEAASGDWTSRNCAASRRRCWVL